MRIAVQPRDWQRRWRNSLLTALGHCYHMEREAIDGIHVEADKLHGTAWNTDYFRDVSKTPALPLLVFELLVKRACLSSTCTSGLQRDKLLKRSQAPNLKTDRTLAVLRPD